MSTHTSDQSVVRQVERARMWRALDTLAVGSPGVLQLVGEAGIGKSYLLGELLTEAGRRGHRTALGRARELGSEAPFGMFAEALD